MAAGSVTYIPYPPGMAHLEELLERLTERMTEGIEADARSNWSHHVETGKTLASVRAEHHGRTGRVWVTGKVWHFVEYGTAPHTITSKGGAMAYPLRNKAKGFFAYPGHVNHPGNEEFAPMRHAAYRKRDEFGIPISPSMLGL